MDTVKKGYIFNTRLTTGPPNHLNLTKNCDSELSANNEAVASRSPVDHSVKSSREIFHIQKQEQWQAERSFKLQFTVG